MRNELTLMELVDRYLSGELNATERAAFEERMRTNAELRELVEDQRALHGGLQRLALRPAIHKAYHSYKWGKWAPGIGGAALIAILAVGGWMLAKEGGHTTEATSDRSERSEQLLTLNDTTGTGLPALVMMIDPTRDTTLLTPSGSLLDVPSKTFVDAAGNMVVTPVRVTMLEAFDAASITKAGLSTMSGDTLLETGGMFFLAASSNGSPVAIALGKTINVLIPADGVKAGMKLYDGVLGADSIVDWIDPVELPRTLVPVDITTLDLYPPNYLTTIAEIGSNATDKSFTDSLYWTFDCRQLIARDATNGSPISEAASDQVRASLSDMGAPVPAIRANRIAQTSGKNDRRLRVCGIDPAKVRTIWSERFNGTNLATREFEERMRAIHRTCDNAVLDLYVSNLDEDLRTLDRRAVGLGYGAFGPFAERNEGRVELPAGSAGRLERIYQEWSRAHADAVRNAQNAYWERQRELDEKNAQRQRVDQESESASRQQLLQDETEANMQSVYTQLGYAVQPEPRSIGNNASALSASAARRPVTLPAPPRSVFNAQVRTLGWKNIDQAMNAAYARQSTSVSDGVSTRRATITYDPCIVSVTDDNTYDEVRVYLIPKGFSSFQRMRKGLGNRYEEKLNALFTYDLIILAQKTGSSWYFERRGLQGTSQLTAALEPITEEQLTRNLMGFDRIRGTALLNASNYMSFVAADAPRQRSNMDKQALRVKLELVVFPCAGNRTEEKRRIQTEASSEPIWDIPTGVMTTFDEPPSFPGGDRAMRQFIYDNLRNPEIVDQEGLTDRITVEFAVEADGRLTRIRSIQGADQSCKVEAERVVGIMPNWTPAMLNGRPVTAVMLVPVVFLPRMNRLN